MAKEIKYGAEARNALQNGVNQVSKYRKCNSWTERKKRCSGQTVRRTAHHKRWCYDCKRDRAGRRL